MTKEMTDRTPTSVLPLVTDELLLRTGVNQTGCRVILILQFPESARVFNVIQLNMPTGFVSIVFLVAVSEPSATRG
jgi:hypothetical protein